MSNNSRKGYFSFFFFFVVHILFGQESAVPLLKAIKLLENKFNVTFSYTDKYINQSIFLSKTTNLLVCLDYLERQTRLRFEKLSEKQIIVRPFNNQDTVDVCGYVVNSGFVGNKIGVRVGKELVYTDKNGYFNLKGVKYNASVSFLNDDFLLKKSVVKDIFNTNCNDVELSNLDFKLKEVVIKNYLADGITKKEQITTFTTENFKVLAGLTEPDLIQTIQQIPNATTPFETASQVHVRGGSPDQNLVLWNGIKTYNQSHFFGLLSAFNPYVIDQLDFYNKGITANYGGRLSSVIVLKSDSKIQNKFSGNIGSNLLYSDAVFKIPLVKDKLSVSLAGRRSFSDLWESPTFNSFSDRVFQNTTINDSKDGKDRFVFFDYNLGVNYAPTKKDKLQVNGLFAQDDLSFTTTNKDFLFADELKTVNNGISLQWQHQFNKKLSFETNIGVANYLLDYSFQSRALELGERRESSKKNFIKDINSHAQFNYQFNNTQNLYLGVGVEQNDIRYEFREAEPAFSIILDERKDKLDTQSLYGSYQYKKSKKITAQLGLRFNNYSVDKTIYLEPRLYVKAHVNDYFSVNTTLTLTSQAVTQINESVASNLSLENFVWRVATGDNFKVLRSRHSSFGATYKKRGWLIEVDTFYKQTDNITTITSGFVTEFNDVFQLGEQQVFGGDFFIKKKIKDYSSWLSLSYLNQKNRFENFNDGDFFKGNTNIDYSINWSHFYNYKNFNFAVSWLWHTGKSVTNRENIRSFGTPLQIEFSELNTGNLPVYHRLDISALYNFKLKPKSKLKYKLGASIQNLYNRESIINREFRVSPGVNNSLLTTDFNSLGITPNLNFRVLW